MITKWKVANFKSIRDETELDLGLLTIFAGANSSGKSTIIQSILLVAQTLAHKTRSSSVVLNGVLTSLGQFDDLKSIGGKSDQITIKCTCLPRTYVNARMGKRFRFRRLRHPYRPIILRNREIDCEISFDADPTSNHRDLCQIQPRLFSTYLSCKSKDEDNQDWLANISIGPDGVELDDRSLSEAREKYRSAKPVDCTMRHFLPEEIIYEIDTIEERANVITLVLQGYSRHPIGFLRRLERGTYLSAEVIEVLRDVLKGTIDFDKTFMKDRLGGSKISSEPGTLSLGSWHKTLRRLSREERLKIQQVLQEKDDLFECIHKALRDAAPEDENTIDIVEVMPPRLIRDVILYLGNFFASSFQYLGPLRVAPKPLYPLAPAADPYDVGLRGEHTASILELHKNDKIRYLPSANFAGSAIDSKMVKVTLEEAVIDWLQYLGVASSVKSSDQGKLGHELKVGLSDSDNSHDLTHVGVGVSQILPILVMCLLADPDSTLIFEQPELHLHPKVQTLLGDFFLSMALCNKQCLVETHSEYLIDRLRFRIAAAISANELKNLTKIYFVEKPSQGSTFREVEINDYGAISDWPEGFFDQSQQQAEEILIAAAMKRKSRRRKDDK